MMKLSNKINLILIGLSLCAVKLTAQQSIELYTNIEYPVIPVKYCDLEESMKETSGIIFSSGFVWTINDSGGEPEIYKIDKETGTVCQTVKLLNATNIDWEDISEDDDFFYIGDIGNNDGDRTDLKIYRIAKKNVKNKKYVEVNAEIIKFSFQDQKSFEENSRNHNYDCESLISCRDTLLLFSKNWVDGKSRMYKLPKVSGDYKLNPAELFESDGLITGGDFNSTLNKLALIGYKDHQPFIFMVNDFDGTTLAGKEIFRFNLFKMKDSQAEGIAWSVGETVLFSTEQTKSFSQQVFEFDIRQVFKIMGK
jgi:hypothetical protein